MGTLLDGAVKFMEEDFLEHKELFESLGDKQVPHTLFIGCIDSRVVPNARRPRRRAKYRQYRAALPQKRRIFSHHFGDRIRHSNAKRKKRYRLRAQQLRRLRGALARRGEISKNAQR